MVRIQKAVVYPVFCLPDHELCWGVRHMAGKGGLAYKRHPGVKVPGLITNEEQTPLQKDI